MLAQTIMERFNLSDGWDLIVARSWNNKCWSCEVCNMMIVISSWNGFEWLCQNVFEMGSMLLHFIRSNVTNAK